MSKSLRPSNKVKVTLLIRQKMLQEKKVQREIMKYSCEYMELEVACDGQSTVQGAVLINLNIPLLTPES